MYKGNVISVVVPAYKVLKKIEGVVEGLPNFVDNIIVIDDACPQKSSDTVKMLPKVTVVTHESNQGVGGAIASGYKKALSIDSDIVVKVDGDGQMDPSYIEALIVPIVSGEAEYCKGNRFNDFSALKQMPKVRLFGNSMLSFMVKTASGYWNIMDPTNGFTAISSNAIKGLEFEKIAKRYFFETDMLVNLNIEGCVVADVPIPAKYEDEDSNLNIVNVLLTFPFKMFERLCRRVFYKYYIYNFDMGSVYLLIGLPMLLFGITFGAYRWGTGLVENVANSVGTVMLSVIPIVLGVQFLLQFIAIDIENTPRKK